jgi:hypothetical protein
MTTLSTHATTDTRVASSPTRKAKTWLGIVKATRLAHEQGCYAGAFLCGDSFCYLETPVDAFLAGHPDIGNLLYIPYTELLAMDEETLIEQLQALCPPTQAKENGLPA